MGDDPEPDDLVELGRQRPRWAGRPGWRPSRGAAVFAVAALAAGLAAGYAAGDRHVLPPSRKTVALVPAPAVRVSSAGSPALSQDSVACATQTGPDLQLGTSSRWREPAGP